MGKFPEADRIIAQTFICKKCKARNKRTSKKCRKCGSPHLRPKRKEIRAKK
ncbi:50S ribosomal protein L40e [Candidatus Micrarchaeota archaeon]|nr:50S ribosomal protein L40e [Candidatus Micrarchaeota archaeon]